MPETNTPICDLLERLLSTGMSTLDAFAAARPTEAALLRTTTARASTPEDRERWAGQKKRQRKMSTRGVLDSRIDDSEGSKKKNPGVDISPDGWPSNFVEVFWTTFPPFRRQAKVKVGAKLARIRAEGKVSWEVLYGGLLKFAATDPGQYAPAPMVWLNDGRWDREYGTQTGGSNGKAQNAGGGFAAVAARFRNAGAPPERPAPEDLEPVNRR